MSCTIVRVPGPQGPAGSDGTNGTDGTSVFTTLTSNFTMPASLASAVADVVSSAAFNIGQVLHLEGAGYLEVLAKPASTQVTLKNLETASNYTSNVAAGTIIASGSQLTAGGVQGPVGTAGNNPAFPTTAKGQIMADNGAGGGSPNVVAVNPGTDGQVLTADAASAAGVDYATITPNTATDNGIPRFDGTTGKPVPLQTSLFTITDDGALQSTGGNARGAKASDLQCERSSATQVASGANSFIGGGSFNTASGIYSFIGSGNTCVTSAPDSAVVTGQTCTASGSFAFIGSGLNNVASSLYSCIVSGTTNTSSSIGSAIVGGGNNTASGLYSFVGSGASNIVSSSYGVCAGGNGNTVTGSYAFIPGGFQALASNTGQNAHASGYFGSPGDAQGSVHVARVQTTTSTPNQLFTDGASTKIVLASNRSWVFSALIVGRDTATGNSAAWKVEGLVKNTGGTMTLVGSTVTLVTTDAAISGTWGIAASITASVDTVLKAIVFNVTGAAATTIRWVGRVVSSEVGE